MNSTLIRHVPLRAGIAQLKRSPLPRQSSKGRQKQREWSKLTREAIAANGGRCAIGIPGVCTGAATEGHHRFKRRFGVEQQPVPTCHACHMYMESHPNEARARGLSLNGNHLPVKGITRCI